MTLLCCCDFDFTSSSVSSVSESHENGGEKMSVNDIGLRWAAALREKYMNGCLAKRIARDFNVETRTANSWLQGNAPYAKHLCRAGQLFGPAFVLKVISPDSLLAEVAEADQAIMYLRRGLDELEVRLERLRSR